MEEASAPDNLYDCHQKSRSSAREAPRYDDEEEKDGISDHNEDSTPPAFWHASANAVEVSDLDEPATFQEAISRPDQVHWRKAIQADLESMQLRGVFRNR